MKNSELAQAALHSAGHVVGKKVLASDFADLSCFLSGLVCEAATAEQVDIVKANVERVWDCVLQAKREFDREQELEAARQVREKLTTGLRGRTQHYNN